jgi:hypothetical protein
MRRGWTALRFAAGAALVLGAAYAVSDAVDPVYAEMRARMGVFRDRRGVVEAVTVGNSHGGAIDFALLGVRGMHLWSGGQDAFTSAFLARHVAGQASRLRYVFIAASPGFHQLDPEGITMEDFTGPRREVYAATRTLRHVPGDLDVWMESHLAPVVRPDHWWGVAQRRGLRRPWPRLTAEGKLARPEPPPLSPDSMERYGMRRAARHRQLVSETLAHDSTAPARAIRDLDALARELGRRGIRLVLYTPPYHESYGRHVADDGGELRRALLPLLARNRNAVWLDYSRDVAFTRRAELYLNGDHLNSRGARAFSSRLAACLQAPSAAATPHCPFVRPDLAAR